MNATVRRILTANPLSRGLYFAARQRYTTRRTARAAGRYFLDAEEFKRALHGRGEAGLLDLRTKDGLTITMRRNRGDAATVGEIFLFDCYVHNLILPPRPVIIDVGGFIGDFSLYAVKRLNARRVIVYEPSPRNWELLLKNIASNGYGDRVEAVNKAVTDGRDAMMDIDAPDELQCMVSASNRSGRPLSAVPGISLAEILQEHGVESVDLLKIDCEGGEFAILESAPSDALARVQNIVFEYHQIDGVWGRLEGLKRRLRREGYALSMHGGLVWASRLQGYRGKTAGEDEGDRG